MSALCVNVSGPGAQRGARIHPAARRIEGGERHSFSAMTHLRMALDMPRTSGIDPAHFPIDSRLPTRVTQREQLPGQLRRVTSAAPTPVTFRNPVRGHVKEGMSGLPGKKTKIDNLRTPGAAPHTPLRPEPTGLPVFATHCSCQREHLPESK
jgi:hypothetical protein